MFSSFQSQQVPTQFGALVSPRGAQAASWSWNTINLVRLVKVWMTRRSVNIALSRMNAHLLRDIGLSQADIPAFLKTIR